MVAPRNYGPGDPQFEALSAPDKKNYLDMTYTGISDNYANIVYQASLQKNAPLSYGSNPNAPDYVDVYTQRPNPTIQELRLQGSSPTNYLPGQNLDTYNSNVIPTTKNIKASYLNTNMSYMPTTTSNMYVAPNQQASDLYDSNKNLYNTKLSSFNTALRNDPLAESRLSSIGISPEKWFGSAAIQDVAYQKLGDTPMKRPTVSNTLGFVQASGDYTKLQYNPNTGFLQPSTNSFMASTNYGINPGQSQLMTNIGFNGVSNYKPGSAASSPSFYDENLGLGSQEEIAIANHQKFGSSATGLKDSAGNFVIDPSGSGAYWEYTNVTASNKTPFGNVSPSGASAVMRNIGTSPTPSFYNAAMSGTLKSATLDNSSTRVQAPYIDRQSSFSPISYPTMGNQNFGNVSNATGYNNLVGNKIANTNFFPQSSQAQIAASNEAAGYPSINGTAYRTNSNAAPAQNKVLASNQNSMMLSILGTFLGGVSTNIGVAKSIYSGIKSIASPSAYADVPTSGITMQPTKSTIKNTEYKVVNFDPLISSQSLGNNLNQNTLLQNVKYNVVDPTAGKSYYNTNGSNTYQPIDNNTILYYGATNAQNYNLQNKGVGAYAMQSVKGGQSAVISTSDIFGNVPATVLRTDHEVLHTLGYPADDMSTNMGYQSQLKATGKIANEPDYYKYLIGTTPTAPVKPQPTMVSKTFSPVTVKNKVLANDTFTSSRTATAKIEPSPNIFDWLTSWARPQNEQQNTMFNNYKYADGTTLLKRKQSPNKGKKLYKVTKPVKRVIQTNHKKATIKTPKLLAPPRVTQRPLKPIATRAKVNTKVITGGMIRGFGNQKPMISKNATKAVRIQKPSKQKSKGILNYFY